jgi:hypothetical protein
MNWKTSHSFSRRDMLNRVSSGFGMMALSGLTASNSFGAISTVKRKRHPDFRPKAKQVILCYMSGGVSHVDTFDPKPRLRDMHGKPMPVKVERTQFNNNGNIFGSPFDFSPEGESGIPISALTISASFAR